MQENLDSAHHQQYQFALGNSPQLTQRAPPCVEGMKQWCTSSAGKTVAQECRSSSNQLPIHREEWNTVVTEPAIRTNQRINTISFKDSFGLVAGMEEEEQSFIDMAMNHGDGNLGFSGATHAGSRLSTPHFEASDIFSHNQQDGNLSSTPGSQEVKGITYTNWLSNLGPISPTTIEEVDSTELLDSKRTELGETENTSAAQPHLRIAEELGQITGTATQEIASTNGDETAIEIELPQIGIAPNYATSVANRENEAREAEQT